MSFQALTQDGVHVWCARLNEGEHSVERYRAVLAACELNRASRFHAPVYQHRYVVAHGVLRHLLGLYTGHLPSDVPICQAESGKPLLLDAALEFNLSHSDALAVIAIARRQVGVDIERVRAVPEAKSIAQRYFSRSEAVFIGKVPDQERDLEFLRLWTQKEAVLKGRGLGIRDSCQLARVLDNNARSDRMTSCNLVDSSYWQLGELRLHSDYVGSVAVKGGFNKIETFIWD